MSLAISAMPGFTFGCDPELFIKDQEGRYVSAEGLIPGTKEEPYPVDGGAVQVDGMAAEFNINPSSTFDEFNDNIVKVIRGLRTFLPKGYTLDAVPAVVFDQDVWDRTPDQAKVLGCTPDYNAWTGECNPPPEDLENPRLRTASGHIHIGWTDDESMADMDHINNCRDLVKQLDWYLGGWSLRKDPDPTRRRLYGKAGACRYKPYGVEYRVLSNFWVMSKAERLNVWNRTNKAISDMRHFFLPQVAGKSSEGLIRCINNGERDQYMERTFKFPLQSISKHY